MNLYFSIYCVVLTYTLSEGFFHLSDKPIFLCFKVCPLYCSQRRTDEDASSLIYLDDDPYSFGPDVWIEDPPAHTPYHYGRFVFCKPKPTTTSPKPTTTTTTMAPTTEEPTWICMVCKNKCNYPKS